MKKPNRIARKGDTARSGAQSKPAPFAQRRAAVKKALRKAAEPPQKEQTVIVGMPTPIHHAVMRACRTKGVTFSEFAADAVRRKFASRAQCSFQLLARETLVQPCAPEELLARVENIACVAAKLGFLTTALSAGAIADTFSRADSLAADLYARLAPRSGAPSASGPVSPGAAAAAIFRGVIAGRSRGVSGDDDGEAGLWKMECLADVAGAMGMSAEAKAARALASTLREADDEAMKLATLLDDDEPVRFAAPFACAVWRYASIAKR